MILRALVKRELILIAYNLNIQKKMRGYKFKYVRLTGAAVLMCPNMFNKWKFLWL